MATSGSGRDNDCGGQNDDNSGLTPPSPTLPMKKRKTEGQGDEEENEEVGLSQGRDGNEGDKVDLMEPLSFSPELLITEEGDTQQDSGENEASGSIVAEDVARQVADQILLSDDFAFADHDHNYTGGAVGGSSDYSMLLSTEYTAEVQDYGYNADVGSVTSSSNSLSEIGDIAGEEWTEQEEDADDGVLDVIPLVTRGRQQPPFPPPGERGSVPGPDMMSYLNLNRIESTLEGILGRRLTRHSQQNREREWYESDGISFSDL